MSTEDSIDTEVNVDNGSGALHLAILRKIPKIIGNQVNRLNKAAMALSLDPRPAIFLGMVLVSGTRGRLNRGHPTQKDGRIVKGIPPGAHDFSVILRPTQIVNTWGSLEMDGINVRSPMP